MSDSRSRAEDRAAEEAEERQRQLIGGAEPARKYTATKTAEPAPPPDIATVCGPIRVVRDRVDIQRGGLSFEVSPLEALDILDALRALADAGVLSR